MKFTIGIILEEDSEFWLNTFYSQGRKFFLMIIIHHPFKILIALNI